MAATVVLDANDLKALRQFLQATPQQLKRAQAIALNRAVKSGKAEVARSLKVNLPSKTKKADLFNGRAATVSRLEASLGARDRNHLLNEYGGFSETKGLVKANARGGLSFTRRRGAQGISFKPYRGGGAARFPHGFVIRHGASGKGVAAHRAPAGAASSKVAGWGDGDIAPGQTFRRGELVGRNPLWLLAGPSVADEFGQRIGAYEARLLALYDKRLTESINAVLQGYAKGKP